MGFMKRLWNPVRERDVDGLDYNSLDGFPHQGSDATIPTQHLAKTFFVESKGTKYAYRGIGPMSGVPLLLLQCFRANIDHWDPHLLSLLSCNRPVVLFDNAGVGQSSGKVSDSIKGMAQHVEIFLEALEVERVDILGFGLGGMVAQQVALDMAGTGLIRKLVLSATTPGRGLKGEGVLDGNEDAFNQLAAMPETDIDTFLSQYFCPSDASQVQGKLWFERSSLRDLETCGEQRPSEVQGSGVGAQGMAIEAWSQGQGSYDRLGDIKIPVLVTNGKADFVIPTTNSLVLTQKLPNAFLHIYPDSGHGHMFQWADLYAQHVRMFLEE